MENNIITETLLQEGRVDSEKLILYMTDLFEITDTYSYALKSKMKNQDMYDSYVDVFNNLNKLFYYVRTELVKDKEYRTVLFDVGTLIKLIDDKLNKIEYKVDSNEFFNSLCKEALLEKLNNPLEDALYDTINYLYHILCNSYKDLSISEEARESFEEIVDYLGDLFDENPKEPETILGFNFRDYWDYLFIVEDDEDEDEDEYGNDNDSLSTDFGK